MTFLKSTGKGLLKNVQDEISRPLGSQEINKAKRRGDFFLITVYVLIHRLKVSNHHLQLFSNDRLHTFYNPHLSLVQNKFYIESNQPLR